MLLLILILLLYIILFLKIFELFIPFIINNIKIIISNANNEKNTYLYFKII